MEDTKVVDAAVVSSIAQNIFQVMPLIKKRLVKLSAIQAEQGIPMSHVQVLAILAESGSMSVSEISRRFGIAKPNITPLVDRLLNAGLVDRVRNNTDRRVVNVVIQEAGYRKLEQIQEALNEHVSSWSDSIAPEDYAVLDQSLRNVIRILGGL